MKPIITNTIDWVEMGGHEIRGKWYSVNDISKVLIKGTSGLRQSSRFLARSPYLTASRDMAQTSNNYENLAADVLPPYVAPHNVHSQPELK